MKKYSSNRAQKGKTAYRTPSRWIKNQPELFKKRQGTKLHPRFQLVDSKYYTTHST